MDDLFNAPRPVTNIPEMSVSELSAGVKRTIESAFGYVRVRGEISKVTLAKSGHLYTTLKDENANLEAVAWKATVQRLSIRPAEGMEVIATGKLTTYPGRSNYQLIIESLELAGQGAILKMLEDRKNRLAAEGLFAAERKKPLPFLPKTIGVVTSPTGAVIRDILHRLADRFPVHVLLWPAVVQGQTAAQEVARGIEGLNNLPTPPDLIIVARGGGSFEDLMPFSEEIVVRAAAASKVPLISAVGHETDVTLIDFAADRRAPTPTGAAEMAVPVRDDILNTVIDWRHRMATAMLNTMRHAHRGLDHATRSLGSPQRLLENPMQRLDRAGLSAEHAFEKRLNLAERALARTATRLRTPQDVLQTATTRLDRTQSRLGLLLDRRLAALDKRLAPLRPRTPQDVLNTAHLKLANTATRLERIPLFEKRADRLANAARMLESMSFKKVLDRGFAVVRDENGKLLSRAAQLQKNQPVTLTFTDTTRKAVVDD